MELTNYYTLLKIEQSADLEVIKKAFRTEIALYHPDKNKTEGAKVHFDLLVEAFDILSNTNKRKAYDEMLVKNSSNSDVLVTSTKEDQFEEQQYKEWKKESKKKSEKYWRTELKELLLLDIFLEAGMSGLFSGVDSLLDGLGDSLDGIGDLFDVF